MSRHAAVVVVALLAFLLPAAPLIAQCTAESADFQWGKFHQGKYHRVQFVKGLEKRLNYRALDDFMAMLDLTYEVMRDTFGWPFVGGRDADLALRNFVQPRIQTGTGDGGSCYGVEDNFGIVYDEVGSDFGLDSIGAEYTLWVGLVHEQVHLWDFRNGLWMQGVDGTGAHAFTEGMEYWFNAVLGFRPPTTFENQGGAVPPQNILAWRERRALDRYIDNPKLDWNTYHSNVAQQSFVDGTANRPRAWESLGIQGAFILRLMRLHGVKEMKGFWDAIEQLRVAEEAAGRPVFGLKQAEVNENFFDLLAAGLGIDPTPYFEYFKYPIPPGARERVVGLARSPFLDDEDGDGYSPLEGDYDDSDATVFPDAPELADGKDNNLDGQVDEMVLIEKGDFPDNPANAIDLELPAYVRGELKSKRDRDSFRFTTPKDSLVIMRFGSIDSKKKPKYFGYRVEAFSGRAEIDGEFASEIFDHVDMSGVFIVPLRAGQHSLEIVWGSATPNIGTYEFQILVFDYTPKKAKGATTSYEHKVYDHLRPDPGFDCGTAKGLKRAECEALKKLFNTYGDAWVHTGGWLTTDDVCYWRGLHCDKKGLTKLMFPPGDSRLLTGQPLRREDLAPFKRLRQLQIFGDFDHAVQSGDAFATLKQLRQFKMVDSKVSGRIPESLGKLPRITTIILTHNEFTGPLPTSWGGSKTLRYIDLEGNGGLDRMVPGAWTSLDLLTLYLDADGCAQNAAVQKWFKEIPQRSPQNLQICK